MISPSYALLLLVAILTQTLLTLVRGHLMALPFFSAWHSYWVLIFRSGFSGF